MILGSIFTVIVYNSYNNCQTRLTLKLYLDANFTNSDTNFTNLRELGGEGVSLSLLATAAGRFAGKLQI